MTTTRKKPELSAIDQARAASLIAANLAMPAMANDPGITIRGKSPWKPSVTATARVKDPQPAPHRCPCCAGTAVACVHHEELHGHSNSIWPWSFVCRGCGATAGLIAFTNMPAAALQRAGQRA